MLGINLDDVKTVLGLMKYQLIFLAVVFVAALAVIIIAGKFKKPLRKLVRSNAILAFIAALTLFVNLILTGPLYSIVNLSLGESGNISTESIEAAKQLGVQIAEEGIVLLKNEDNILPLKTNKVNTFGWGATNPVYGGTGSGSLSDTYPTVSLLEGLTNSNIEYNTELTDFYKNLERIVLW